MALLHCPDCQGKVSSRAPACPHCGCPIEYFQNPQNIHLVPSMGEQQGGSKSPGVLPNSPNPGPLGISELSGINSKSPKIPEKIVRGDIYSRDGLTFELGSQTPLTARVQECYPNGILFKEAIYVNGYLEGWSREWGTDGTLHEEAFYHKGNYHGAKKSYRGNGRLYLESHYQNGKEHGVQKGWHKNGSVSFEIHYSEGVQDGTASYFDPDGTLKSRVHYSHGKVISDPAKLD